MAQCPHPRAAVAALTGSPPSGGPGAEKIAKRSFAALPGGAMRPLQNRKNF